MKFSPRLALALLPAALAAQEPAPKKPDFPTLERDYEAAQEQYTAARRAAARNPDAPRPAEPAPQVAFLPRFQAGAVAHAGTPDATPFLVWIVRHGRGDAATDAMTTLMERHVDDPRIRYAVARVGGLHQVFGKDRSRAWLDRVLEHNEDPGVLAQARYTRAAMYVGTRAVERSEALRAQAIADLRLVLENTHDHRSLHGLAVDLIYEAALLEPGLPAPEIAGEDLDGVPFRLSDYRGKVVLLDFWGDW